MPKWKKMTVGDLCDTISDTYRGDDKDVVLINTSDVLEGKVLNHQVVENKNLKGQFKKTFKENDILYSEIRPANKRYAFVDFGDTDNYIASTKLMVLRPRKDVVRPRFLFSFLASKSVLEELQQLAETRSGTFPQITFSSELAPTPINVPDLKTQDRIVGILDVIEGKISTNAEINKNLEQQAQAYFDELFVVNADPNWSECTLSDIGSVVAGGTPSKSKPEYYADQGIAWITPKDLSVNKSKFISHGENDISELGFSKSSAAKMPAGTILFSSRAPIGYIAIAQNEVTTNQGFKSVIPNENIGTAYLYFLLKNLLPTIEGMASGSTFKEISGSAMKSVPTVMPDANTIQLFSSFCEPVFKEQEILEAENQRLSALRNSLLPKLMSGELDASDIDL